MSPETCGTLHAYRIRSTVEAEIPLADQEEPILSFDPRWGEYQPVDLTAHPGPVEVRTLYELARGLSSETWAAVAETGHWLPARQKTDL